jgi:hypothetical protein
MTLLSPNERPFCPRRATPPCLEGMPGRINRPVALREQGT